MTHQGAAPRLAARLLPDGKRLYLSDGPIDLVILAEGEHAAVQAARQAAAHRMATLLDELCAELPLLRQKAAPGSEPRGLVARRMWQATTPHAAQCFITPMAAVAGAVAEAVLAAMLGAAPLDRAFVNNGGDIALHLAPGHQLTAAVIDRPDLPALTGVARIGWADGVGGIATSGWRGRSFSRGIADAVTVLAARAADADACATVIANQVDLPGHDAVTRRPAASLQPDSDLGDRLVTVAVGPLTPSEVGHALDRGAAEAERLLGEGRVAAVLLRLAGATRVIRAGRLPMALSKEVA